MFRYEINFDEIYRVDHCDDEYFVHAGRKGYFLKGGKVLVIYRGENNSLELSYIPPKDVYDELVANLERMISR